MNIDCQYVRQLVRTHPIQPGSLEQQFVDHHLAHCPACRAALNMPSPTLLGALLDTQTPPLPTSHPHYNPDIAPRPPADAPKPAQKQPRPAPPADAPKPAQKQPRPAPAPKPAQKQPRPAPQADAPKPARKQPRPMPQSWSWQHFVVLTVVTIVVSYVVIVGVKAGWDALRIWQGLGIISSSSTPVATESTPGAEAITETLLATSVPHTPTAAQIILPAGSDQPLTVLLLGSDRRPDERGTARTDAVMVMRITPQTKKISLLSFPRDLMVNIPGYGWARINAANVYGELYPQLGGGMQLATQTVSTVIGQPIDYTVLVDFAGFINIINALGGVAVDVPKELYDAQFPTMDYKYREAYFPVGSTMMDGDTALTYSRIRHPDNDFERTTRQQSVIVGIGERLLSGNYLTTLDTAATVTDALIGHAKTDMPREKIIALAWQMRDMDITQVSRFTLRDIYYGSGDDRYAMYPIEGAISRIVSQWLAQ